MTMSERVNEDPYSVGWLIKVEAPDAAAQVQKLMDAAAYDALTAED